MRTCNNCKHVIQYAHKVGVACGHPWAAEVDRIQGALVPVLYAMGRKGKKADETLAKCDEQNWFEPAHPWWSGWL